MAHLSVPKTELHVHIEALMCMDTLRELVQKYKLPLHQIEALQQSISTGYEDILDFFEHWHFLNGTLRQASDFERIAYEYLRDTSAFNTKYVEFNVNILRQVQKGLDPKEVVYAIYQGQKQAFNDFGILSKTLLSYSRDFSIEEGKGVVDMCVDFEKYNVCGLDIAGNEKAKPNKHYIPVFKYADKKEIRKTAHAGEGAGQDSIRDAIEQMNVSRIGHGVDALNDYETLTLIKESGVTVEICATSNTVLGVSDSIKTHVGKQMLDSGIPIVINTDDPTLLGLSLADEYQVVTEAWDLKEQDLLQIYENGVNAAFINREEREYLIG